MSELSIYSFPFVFSQWSGCNQSNFISSMVWMKPVHFSFLDGLDATSPFFFSQWSGCNQFIFLFLVVWMQPVHFSFLGGLDATSPFFFSRWSGFSRSKSTRERDEELWLFLLTPALCFHVWGSWGGSFRASPSSIVADDDDYLEHRWRLRRGTSWVWKAAQETRDHGLRKFHAIQCM